MADFNMNLKGLSLEAQKFLFEKDIENGDGVMTTSERNKLAEYLSGNKNFPEGYEDVKTEIINFVRMFDVKAMESNLSKERKAAVRNNMSDKDKNAIDSINDYQRLKDVAEGKGNYTSEQREYARALIENSSYARELQLEEQKGVLQTKVQELSEENQSLKAELAELSDNAKEEKAIAQEVLGSLNGLPTNISSSIKGYVNNIDSSNDTIINSYKNYNNSLENFKKGTISETTLKKSLQTAKESVNRAKEEIEHAKKEGNKVLEESKTDIAKIGDETVKATANSALIAAMKLFGNAAANAIKMTDSSIKE